MYITQIFGLILILILPIYNIYVLPFDTIYLNTILQNEQNKENSDLYNNLFHTELYINLSIGTPPRNIKSLLKFESKGFYINEGAFNYTLSSSSKKYYWQINKYFFNSISYLIVDYFYFPFYESFSDFNKKIESNIKSNETLFIVMNKKRKNINNIYFNYGYIGLDYKEKNNNESPENTYSFFETVHKNWNIKKNIFYFIFDKENNTYKDYFNNYHKGYFIFGDELTSDENEKNKIQYTYLSKDIKRNNWIIYFDNIYLTAKDKNIIFNYNNINSNIKYGTELKINLPYIIGTDEYLNYINNSFFNEFIDKKICLYNLLNNTINGKYYYSFICNSKSEYFMKKLDNSFPDITFENKDLDKNFTLSKNDLFAYNNMDKTDNNLYFLIIFNKEEKSINKNWILGIPFFRKNILSFDYENKKIGYYDKLNVYMNEKTSNNRFTNFFGKIIFIIFLVVIIFVLGMIFQKKLIKIPRKIKANELDDDYNYISYNSEHNKDINNNEDNRNKKNVELGLKFNN